MHRIFVIGGLRTGATAARVALRVVAAICIASITYAQPRQPSSVSTILPDVALLFHGSYGEESFNLTSNIDDAVSLEELGPRRMRLQIQRVPNTDCAFVAMHNTPAGVDVQQLDFAKFDGTYQLWEACGPKGSPLERTCTYSLHFSSPQAYCESVFRDQPTDLTAINFPDGACQSYSLGAREKRFYAKYIDAFKRIRTQCGGNR